MDDLQKDRADCRKMEKTQGNEEEMLLSRQWMALHVQQTPLGVIEFAVDGRIRGWNPAAEKIFGYSREEAIGQHWHFIAPQDVRESLDGVWEGLVSQRSGSRSTNKNNTRDGRIIDCEWFNTPLVDPQGKTIGVASLVMDVTERKQTEEKYRSLIETTDTGYVILNSQGIVMDANSEYVALTGRNHRDKVIGHSVLDWTAPYDRERNAAAVRKCIEQGHIRSFEVDYLSTAGKATPIEINATFLSGEGTFSILSLCRDITERKEAEKKILQSEEFIRSILNTVDEGFIVVDRDYRILTANKAYCSQVGGCDEKIIGKHCYEISHRSNRPCYELGEECATRHAFETGTPHTALHRHKDANDNILYVETKAYPIKDASGAVTSVIEAINNITEKYLLEEERLKTQKLESIGILAGGIAHDFNNLLQGVFGYISMAKITHDQKEKSLAMLDQAEEALHMSVNLTTQLLTFSKGGKPIKKLIRLESTIENAVKFALSGSPTDYRLSMAPDLWAVEADAGQLAQVIQNIVLNANEAMAGRGTVHVSVKNVDIPAKANLRLPEGGQFVRIEIEDTGTGIPKQNMAKIFDPYFTTKQKGSGLGLATSYSIIKNHGGLIEVRSEPNSGTTFTICLPASRNAEVERVTPAVSAAVSTKKLRILLMDDEDLIRNVAKELIMALGHEMEGAEEGKSAIELFNTASKTGRPFDLVILDLTVKGGMGGEETIVNIRKIDPKVKAVVSSGYADSPVVADYRAYGFSAVLNKPYRLDALKNCLDQFIS